MRSTSPTSSPSTADAGGAPRTRPCRARRAVAAAERQGLHQRHDALTTAGHVQLDLEVHSSTDTSALGAAAVDWIATQPRRRLRPTNFRTAHTSLVSSPADSRWPTTRSRGRRATRECDRADPDRSSAAWWTMVTDISDHRCAEEFEQGRPIQGHGVAPTSRDATHCRLHDVLGRACTRGVSGEGYGRWR